MMNRRELMICGLLILGMALFPALWAIGIDWIQMDERVVGEGSPYYADVVNRPAKQIYALYTSEHNEDGSHKPLPYASSADLNSYMLKSVYDANADDEADVSAMLTVTDDTATVSSVDTLRFNPASGFSVTNDGSGDVTIGLGSSWNPIPVVDTDTTCYVALTGSDTTGDGTSGAPYATPHKCLDAYAGYKINPNVWLTVELADGTYTLTTPIEVTHTNGDRIRIRGAHTYETTLSGVSTAGVAGNLAITLTVADASHAAVNDFVIVRAPTGGTNPSYAAGVWKVTATGSGTITVFSSYSWGPSGAVTGTVEILKTMLFNTTSDAILVRNAAVLGDLTGLAIVSDRSNAAIQGVRVAFNATLSITKPLGLSGWETALESSRGSSVNAEYAVVSDCNYCVLATMGAIYMNHAQVVGGNYGLWVGRMGGIEAVGAIVSSIQRNFSAYSFSFIESNQAISTGGTDASPLIDTVGNKNSVVSRD